jgi:2-oxoglutarate dehydrogenase E1 component
MAVSSSTVQVVMPAMGDSVAEGTVLEWHKHEGDQVEADETIVEISTDKVDAEVPAPVAGTIVKTYVAEGDTVRVGAPLAEISTNGADAHPVSGESPPTSPEEQVAAAANEAEQTAAVEAAAGKTVDIVTPTGGESVTEGTILEWSVKVGEAVKQGDTVVEVSTDKVDMEIPAPATGTISEILAGDGETVTVGQVIGRMVSGEAASGERDEKPFTMNEVSSRSGEAVEPAGDGDGASASPLARRIAQEQGIDLTGVTGTARGGRITKADVLAAAGNGATATPQAPATWTRAAACRPLRRSAR